ncbi:hypothetical protein LCGC14_1204950 [marine sediment metagenome]|uniref:Uncharacterized protein n=1 Tax=marine sediment metagenome TaxID=412755 RepID=A0A0F9PKM2_9ZZZZ
MGRTRNEKGRLTMSAPVRRTMLSRPRTNVGRFAGKVNRSQADGVGRLTHCAGRAAGLAIQSHGGC